MTDKANYPARTRILHLALLALLLGSMHASAAPARSKVLEEVSIQQYDDQPVLEIRFSFLFSYRMHFPTNKGSELRIWLRPLQVAPSDRQSITGREGVRPPGGPQFGVDEVVYEGDVREGPWLTIHFTRPVHYRVVHDPDYRGIKVFLDTHN